MDISRKELKRGLPLSVVDEVSVIVISSTGIVKLTKNFPLEAFNAYEYAGIKFNNKSVSSAWTHLKNPLLYNTYYNNIEPYVIEYPFEYKFNDEILQNKIVKTVPNNRNKKQRSNNSNNNNNNRSKKRY